VYGLHYQSLWTDEIFSLTLTDPTLTFREFWGRVLADTHPPIYYLVLHLSSAVFGQSEIVARAPSAFFGVSTLCLAVVLPGSSLSRSSRLAFLLFLSFSPGAVWYAREARSYALLLLLSTVITLACIRFVQCRQHEDRKARGAIVMLAAVSVLASFTHYFGFLLAAAAFLTCFLLSNRRRRAIVVLAGSGVAACFSPWVVYHSQTIDPQRAIWIAELSVAASLRWFEYLSFGGTASLALFIGTSAVLVATGGLASLCGTESHRLGLRTFVLGNASRGGRDFTPYADPDEPQHDSRSSASVLDRSGAHLVLGKALGQSRGRYLPGRSGRADRPAACRVLHDRDK
jgi:uncharacterized membrane protein